MATYKFAAMVFYYNASTRWRICEGQDGLAGQDWLNRGSEGLFSMLASLL
jgi:hypothetical protein